MRSAARPPAPPPVSARWLCVALTLGVLLFALASASPTAHAWLHAATHGECPVPHPDGNEAAKAPTCPVTLFAHGFTVPLHPSALSAPARFAVAIIKPAPVPRRIAGHARLHPPAHAPPAST